MGSEQDVWTARASFRSSLVAWGQRAGVRIVFLTDLDWSIKVPLRLEGSFADAVGKLVRSLSHLERHPVVEASEEALLIRHRTVRER